MRGYLQSIVRRIVKEWLGFTLDFERQTIKQFVENERIDTFDVSTVTDGRGAVGEKESSPTGSGLLDSNKMVK